MGINFSIIIAEKITYMLNVSRFVHGTGWLLLSVLVNRKLVEEWSSFKYVTPRIEII